MKDEEQCLLPSIAATNVSGTEASRRKPATTRIAIESSTQPRATQLLATSSILKTTPKRSKSSMSHWVLKITVSTLQKPSCTILACPIRLKKMRLQLTHLFLSVILLLRRLCRDVNMDAIETGDGWRQYLAPSIRQGFAQIKQSTTYGWAPVKSCKKRRTTTTRRRRRRAPTASSRSKKSSD